MLTNSKGEKPTIDEIVSHLQDEQYGDTIIIQVKKDNSSFTFTAAGCVNEEGKFQEVERFRLLGILEAAKEFTRTFTSNSSQEVLQDADVSQFPSFIFDEIDMILNPQLKEMGFEIGNEVRVTQQVFEEREKHRKLWIETSAAFPSPEGEDSIRETAVR